MSEEQLRNEVQRLRGELKSERSGHSRRVVLRSAAAIAGLGALGIYGVGSAAADPEGVYPVSSEDPFKKIRADRIRYISRSSQPSAPSSGRVISYVDDGDLL
jgi:hypothetical protein